MCWVLYRTFCCIKLSPQFLSSNSCYNWSSNRNFTRCWISHHLIATHSKRCCLQYSLYPSIVNKTTSKGFPIVAPHVSPLTRKVIAESRLVCCTRFFQLYSKILCSYHKSAPCSPDHCGWFLSITWECTTQLLIESLTGWLTYKPLLSKHKF